MNLGHTIDTIEKAMRRRWPKCGVAVRRTGQHAVPVSPREVMYLDGAEGVVERVAGSWHAPAFRADAVGATPAEALEALARSLRVAL